MALFERRKREVEGREERYISLAALQGISCSFLVLAILLTTVRLIQRWRASKRLRVDDLFTVIAAAVLVPYTAMSLVDDALVDEIHEYRAGRSEMPSLERIADTIKMEVACTFLLYVIIYAAKANFLAKYWRAFCSGSVARGFWYGLVVFSALSTGILFMSVFWVCKAPSKVGELYACQDLSVPDALRLLTVWCVFNVVDTLLLMMYPVFNFMSSRTRLSSRQIVLVVVLYILAIFFIALDILRTYWGLSIAMAETSNFILLWRLLEPNTAVLLAATSGFIDLWRSRGEDSEVYTEDRAWIEIHTVNKEISI